MTGDDAREGLTAVLSVKLPDPKFSSQTKDKLVSSEVKPVVGAGRREALRGVPARASRTKRNHRRQDHRCRACTRSRAQGTRDDASQRRARHRRPARQARGLPGKGSRAVRAVSRRRRFGRRLREAGPRSSYAGDAAAQGKILNVEKARFDRMLPSEEVGTLIIALGCGIGRDEFDVSEAPLSPHHHHDGRRRRRITHPHAAADVLLPSDARAHRARPHLHRATAAVQGEARQAGALRQGRRRAEFAAARRARWPMPRCTLRRARRRFRARRSRRSRCTTWRPTPIIQRWGRRYDGDVLRTLMSMEPDRTRASSTTPSRAANGRSGSSSSCTTT